MSISEKKSEETKIIRDVIFLFVALCIFSILALITMFYV